MFYLFGWGQRELSGDAVDEAHRVIKAARAFHQNQIDEEEYTAVVGETQLLN